jgi:hypothetical protein
MDEMPVEVLQRSAEVGNLLTDLLYELMGVEQLPTDATERPKLAAVLTAAKLISNKGY